MAASLEWSEPTGVMMAPGRSLVTIAVTRCGDAQLR